MKTINICLCFQTATAATESTESVEMPEAFLFKVSTKLCFHLTNNGLLIRILSRRCETCICVNIGESNAWLQCQWLGWVGDEGRRCGAGSELWKSRWAGSYSCLFRDLSDVSYDHLTDFVRFVRRTKGGWWESKSLTGFCIKILGKRESFLKTSPRGCERLWSAWSVTLFPPSILLLFASFENADKKNYYTNKCTATGNLLVMFVEVVDRLVSALFWVSSLIFVML